MPDNPKMVANSKRSYGTSMQHEYSVAAEPEQAAGNSKGEFISMKAAAAMMSFFLITQLIRTESPRKFKTDVPMMDVTHLENITNGESSWSNGSVLSFSAYNSYTVESPITNYPWSKIVEPYRETTFEATTKVNLSSAVYVWEFEGESTKQYGNKIRYTFSSTGLHKVHLIQRREESRTSDVFKGEVMVKYVRREVRSLVHDDRNTFLSALHTVYHVSTQEGRTKYGYGANYKHISYFARLHLAGAAARDCDHWHDGAGLMVHHMSFTLELEQALQSIDPSVTVPYWDYSIDAAEFGSDWLNSKIFDPDWFGPVKNVKAAVADSEELQTGTHVVSEGRWAYTPIMADAGTFSPITNAHGLLRSPWNTNPTPFLTRWIKVFNFTNAGYSSFPDCQSMFQCFASDTLTDMHECLNGDTHGPVHVMLGGQWHQATKQRLVIHYYSLERVQLLIFKNLWRRGYASCPSSCDDTDTCECSCPSDVVDERSAYQILNETDVLHWIDQVSPMIYYDTKELRYRIKNLEAPHEDKQWHLVLQSLCSPAYVGELYTSNAPYDPLFWPIHTTAERLMNWKRILTNLGYVDFDQTWGYKHPANTPSDTGVVCDWDRIDSAAATLPRCEVSECEGHAADDVLPSGNFTGAGEVYTNQEFYNFMDPYNADLPYLYDNFEWSYCDEQGYRMSSVNWFHDDDTYTVDAVSTDIAEGMETPEGAEDGGDQLMSDDMMNMPPVMPMGPMSS